MGDTVDSCFLNEPIATERELVVGLVNANGDYVTGQAGVATIKVSTPGTTAFSASTATLTEITAGGDPNNGLYRLRYPLAEVSAIGKSAYEITNGTTIRPCKIFIDVGPLDCLYYGVVANVPDGTHIDLDASNPGGNAVAQDGYYAKSSTGRVCQVRVVAGTGAGQHRLGINYTALNHRLQLDEAFVTPLDTTSVVRIEACITTPASSQDTRFANLDATISSRATDAHVTAIPTNPLLTTDSRLGNLDATISSRSTNSGLVTAMLTAVLGNDGVRNRTVQGVLRRLDWWMTSKAANLISNAVATFSQYDGVTGGIGANQNPTTGARDAATIVAGD